MAFDPSQISLDETVSYDACVLWLDAIAHEDSFNKSPSIFSFYYDRFCFR